MGTFIFAAVILCFFAGVFFVQMKQRLVHYYGLDQEKREVDKDYRKKPSDRLLLVYLLLCTAINLAMMGLSYFVYKDNALYTLKLAFIFQWIAMIAIIDFCCYVIPNLFVLEGLVGAVIFAAVEILFFSYPPIVCLKDYLFGFLLGTGVFLLSALLSRGSIGTGDIKLYAVCGLLLGCIPEFQLMFYSIAVSAIGSIIVLISRKGNRKTVLPFAPFTCAGMLIITLLGV